MSRLEIRKAGDPVLRQIAEPVKKIDKKTKNLLNDMALTMYAANGVGLAAPQVGKLTRVIVIDIGEGLLEMINPEIIAKEGSCTHIEGCLSVPDFDGEVERAEKVKVKFLDRTGKSVILPAEGLLAIAAQHEIDHLDGILFVDKAKALVKKEEQDKQ
ncbi:MAG TPA: peptide deformylase [Candidatus Avacidaminococcus intestinavium]|uniref:Peptide deformylase n=1 Tax=Candidatus Avacidaminococcus intestinavium TaxID=2840684 RepID=A0A9D1MPE2_9FIRM|nr:peptide deformylase [Candidatus Avacidaminococcus intestinavium]